MIVTNENSCNKNENIENVQVIPNYGNLEQNIIDVIAEQQATLGYLKETVRLYYPADSLKHLLNIEGNEAELRRELENFAAFAKSRLGEIKILKTDDRYCIRCSETASEYIHLNVREDSFIFKLIRLVAKHGTTIEQVEELFEQEKLPYEKEEVTHGEFDVFFRFVDAEDRYYYCFKQEACHLTFHRFLPEDYEEFGF